MGDFLDYIYLFLTEIHCDEKTYLSDFNILELNGLLYDSECGLSCKCAWKECVFCRCWVLV